MPTKRVHDFAFRVDDHSDVVESREQLPFPCLQPASSATPFVPGAWPRERAFFGGASANTTIHDDDAAPRSLVFVMGNLVTSLILVPFRLLHRLVIRPEAIQIQEIKHENGVRKRRYIDASPADRSYAPTHKPKARALERRTPTHESARRARRIAAANIIRISEQTPHAPPPKVFVPLRQNRPLFDSDESLENAVEDASEDVDGVSIGNVSEDEQDDSYFLRGASFGTPGPPTLTNYKAAPSAPAVPLSESDHKHVLEKASITPMRRALLGNNLSTHRSDGAVPLYTAPNPYTERPRPHQSAFVPSKSQDSSLDVADVIQATGAHLPTNPARNIIGDTPARTAKQSPVQVKVAKQSPGRFKLPAQKDIDNEARLRQHGGIRNSKYEKPIGIGRIHPSTQGRIICPTWLHGTAGGRIVKDMPKNNFPRDFERRTPCTLIDRRTGRMKLEINSLDAKRYRENQMTKGPVLLRSRPQNKSPAATIPKLNINEPKSPYCSDDQWLSGEPGPLGSILRPLPSNGTIQQNGPLSEFFAQAPFTNYAPEPLSQPLDARAAAQPELEQEREARRNGFSKAHSYLPLPQLNPAYREKIDQDLSTLSDAPEVPDALEVPPTPAVAQDVGQDAKVQFNPSMDMGPFYNDPLTDFLSGHRLNASAVFASSGGGSFTSGVAPSASGAQDTTQQMGTRYATQHTTQQIGAQKQTGFEQTDMQSTTQQMGAQHTTQQTGAQDSAQQVNQQPDAQNTTQQTGTQGYTQQTGAQNTAQQTTVQNPTLPAVDQDTATGDEPDKAVEEAELSTDLSDDFLFNSMFGDISIDPDALNAPIVPRASAQVPAPQVQPPRPSVTALVIPLSSAEQTVLTQAAAATGNGAQKSMRVGASKLEAQDFGTLLPQLFAGSQSKWLNDSIVNEYLRILTDDIKAKEGFNQSQSRGTGPAPRVHAFSSFWLGSNTFSRWAEKAHLGGSKFLDAELVLFPICEGNHWRLIAVKPQDRKIEYLDSLGMDGAKFVKKVKLVIQKTVGEEAWDAEPWSVEQNQRSARQLNGSDCGVFTVLNALALLRSVNHNRVAVSDGMMDARKRIAVTIIEQRVTTEFS